MCNGATALTLSEWKNYQKNSRLNWGRNLLGKPIHYFLKTHLYIDHVLTFIAYLWLIKLWSWDAEGDWIWRWRSDKSIPINVLVSNKNSSDKHGILHICHLIHDNITFKSMLFFLILVLLKFKIWFIYSTETCAHEVWLTEYIYMYFPFVTGTATVTLCHCHFQTKTQPTVLWEWEQGFIYFINTYLVKYISQNEILSYKL